MGVFSVAYGVVSYCLFLVTFLYLTAFVGNLPVPKTIDSGVAGPPAQALVVNVLLVALFAVQHSIMARRSFKAWWTRIVPREIERSTFMVFTCLVLAVLYWQWQPVPRPVWTVRDPALAGVLSVVPWAGWALALASTFLINHFELFGLSQVFARAAGRPPGPPQLRTPLFYRYVRHPLYLGFLLAFWATPSMTQGHLLFAVAMTGYILLGIAFEERDLIAQFGQRYLRYREDVGMLLPKVRGAVAGAAKGSATDS